MRKGRIFFPRTKGNIYEKYLGNLFRTFKSEIIELLKFERIIPTAHNFLIYLLLYFIFFNYLFLKVY